MRQHPGRELRRRLPPPPRVQSPAVHRVASQTPPLLGRPAPPLPLTDVRGNALEPARRSPAGRSVVVFHLGFTCVACVTHLVALDTARPRFRARRAHRRRQRRPSRIRPSAAPQIRRHPPPSPQRPRPHQLTGATACGNLCPARTRRTAWPSTALFSSITTARSAGPTSAIDRSATSTSFWKNWTAIAQQPSRGHGDGVSAVEPRAARSIAADPGKMNRRRAPEP